MRGNSTIISPLKIPAWGHCHLWRNVFPWRLACIPRKCLSHALAVHALDVVEEEKSCSLPVEDVETVTSVSCFNIQLALVSASGDGEVYTSVELLRLVGSWSYCVLCWIRDTAFDCLGGLWLPMYWALSTQEISVTFTSVFSVEFRH